MDFTTASVDALLTYWDGWKAAKAGLDMDVAKCRIWLEGWNDYHLEQSPATGWLTWRTPLDTKAADCGGSAGSLSGTGSDQA